MGRKAQWPPPVHPVRGGRGRVRINGVDHYVGKLGSPEAAEAYAELIAAHAAGETPPKQARPLTVAAAVERYDAYARQHYRKPDGTPTSEMEYVRRAGGVLLKTCRSVRADEFRGLALKKVRDEMVRRGWCRTNVNHHCNVIKRIWKWLASEELVSAEAYGSLRAVEALKAGRTAAPERAKVLPADPAHVEACVPHLSPHLRAAVRLQLATACRPGEALALDPAEVEMAGAVWLWRPLSHKTAHHGKGKLILIGPKAQAVLTPLLADHQGGVLFGPKKSEALRRQEVRRRSATPRRTSLARRYPLTDVYSVEAYHKAIARACDRAGVPAFAPNRLRHLAGTLLAAEFGVEVARILLGHQNVRTTELYAEMDLAKAMAAAMQVG